MPAEIVILTGAGISAESGLGTFRDRGGIWSRVRIGDVATPQAFARDPERVRAFYRMRVETHAGAGPNAAHFALAALARGLGERVMLVTQNVDTLHEQAGSRDVLHMHGVLRASKCAGCGVRWQGDPHWFEAAACPRCGDAALRPDVVWFGEEPYELDRIFPALERCRLFVAIGTSGSVYPAAGFVAEAARSGARCLELNLERSEGADQFDETRQGPASETVPAWVAEILAECA